MQNEYTMIAISSAENEVHSVQQKETNSNAV
jgi:hypothetical protein